MTAPAATPPQEAPGPGLAWLFFSPRGRLSRRLFAQGWLFGACLFSACIAAIMEGETSPAIAGIGLLALIPVLPFWVISTVLLGFKRVHDMGVPGPVAFVLLLPGPGLAAVALFSLWPPRLVDNPYGPLRDGPG